MSDRFSFCMDNFKKYLPSKNFISLVLLIITFVLIFFIGKGLISLIKNRERKDGAKEPEIVSIKEIIDEDDNNNGIPNWEEYFWGLDPKKDGKKNREFVLAKRELANQNTGNEVKGEPVVLTENEALSRDFFVAILALSQEGLLDEESINTIAETIGQKVIADPIADKYTADQVIIEENPTVDSVLAYGDQIVNLFEKYSSEKDIGEEIKIIALGIGNNDTTAMRAVRSIALGYRLLGQDIITIPVIEDLATIHLDIANNCEKVAISIEGIAEGLEKPDLALRALINYQKYYDDLISNISSQE